MRIFRKKKHLHIEFQSDLLFTMKFPLLPFSVGVWENLLDFLNFGEICWWKFGENYYFGIASEIIENSIDFS